MKSGGFTKKSHEPKRSWALTTSMVVPVRRTGTVFPLWSHTPFHRGYHAGLLQLLDRLFVYLEIFRWSQLPPIYLATLQCFTCRANRQTLGVLKVVNASFIDDTCTRDEGGRYDHQARQHRRSGPASRMMNPPFEVPTLHPITSPISEIAYEPFI